MGKQSGSSANEQTNINSSPGLKDLAENQDGMDADPPKEEGFTWDNDNGKWVLRLIGRGSGSFLVSPDWELDERTANDWMGWFTRELREWELGIRSLANRPVSSEDKIHFIAKI